ncbi:MCE family protein [Amycolatopsis sp. NPDC059657]|uniref:MCE family protein n=1 Tax=Amycolatopsis sp. NPDC059657 TaxID=3346899 RepID=UPI0036734EDD
MISPWGRKPVATGLVGITVLALGVLAALNVDALPLVGAGTTYSAEFSESAGLRTDNDVRVAGIKVGKVADVKLDGGKVKVTFRVKNVWLGDKTIAYIKIKTVLGQQFLALDPQGDGTLDPADPIPLERTVAPYAMLDAFRDLTTTVNDIDTAQLAKSFDTIAATFANTPDNVRGALNGLSKLSDTLASRDKQLGQLLANTRQVSQTLVDRDAQLVKLMEDGNKLLDEVSKRKQAISHLLDATKALAVQLNGLVDDNDKQLEPVLKQLDQLTSMLSRNQESLADGIARFAPMVRLLTGVAGNGRWVDAYLCGLILPSIGPLNEAGCFEK